MIASASYCTCTEKELQKKAYDLKKILASCVLCPRQCKVNRLKGEKGYCRAGVEAHVASVNIHHGEEPPISGIKGSGTIFFAHCTMHCVFCQNYPISQLGHGNVMDDKALADAMLDLQRQSAHNINLVTPTHFLPAVINALILARSRGLCIPIVYNSGGYERPEIMALLENIIDIYMPDAKYCSNTIAAKYSDASDYAAYNAASLKEMFRQVGNLKVDDRGIAEHGLLVRHLVLPGNRADSMNVLSFLRREISKDLYVSIMAQYHPAHKADTFVELKNILTKQEYHTVLDAADALGLTNGWKQHL